MSLYQWSVILSCLLNNYDTNNCVELFLCKCDCKDSKDKECCPGVLLYIQKMMSAMNWIKPFTLMKYEELHKYVE